MKSILSINNKFMCYTPNELIKLVKENSKYIDGFEIYVDYHNPVEMEYLKELANCCKLNNCHFQVHGNSYLSLNEQISFLKILESLSNLFDYKINVVLHSVKASTNEESIKLTTDYITNLVSAIDNSKITLSLENLNDIPGEDRLDINDIIPIVANDENIFMTYDIGHEIVEYHEIMKNDEKSEYTVPLISNVHIHSTNYDFYSSGFDHKPIFKGDSNWNDIIKGIIFLKHNNYDKSVVFEYDLYACPGETIEEKIISYCESIDYVSERFK